MRYVLANNGGRHVSSCGYPVNAGDFTILGVRWQGAAALPRFPET